MNRSDLDGRIMQFETLNKLYLELSQVTTVVSQRESDLIRVLAAAKALVNAQYWHALESEEKLLETSLIVGGFISEDNDG